MGLAPPRAAPGAASRGRASSGARAAEGFPGRRRTNLDPGVRGNSQEASRSAPHPPSPLWGPPSAPGAEAREGRRRRGRAAPAAPGSAASPAHPCQCGFSFFPPSSQPAFSLFRTLPFPGKRGYAGNGACVALLAGPRGPTLCPGSAFNPRPSLGVPPCGCRTATMGTDSEPPRVQIAALPLAGCVP